MYGNWMEQAIEAKSSLAEGISKTTDNDFRLEGREWEDQALKAFNFQMDEAFILDREVMEEKEEAARKRLQHEIENIRKFGPLNQLSEKII